MLDNSGIINAAPREENWRLESDWLGLILPQLPSSNHQVSGGREGQNLTLLGVELKAIATEFQHTSLSFRPEAAELPVLSRRPEPVKGESKGEWSCWRGEIFAVCLTTAASSTRLRAGDRQAIGLMVVVVGLILPQLPSSNHQVSGGREGQNLLKPGRLTRNWGRNAAFRNANPPKPMTIGRGRKSQQRQTSWQIQASRACLFA
jgi:hypothetical protein